MVIDAISVALKQKWFLIFETNQFFDKLYLKFSNLANLKPIINYIQFISTTVEKKSYYFNSSF